MTITVAFRHFTTAATKAIASPPSIALHVVAIVGWLALGSHFEWSIGWNFLGSNSISIETLLVGLLILAASQRESEVTQAKENSLLRAVPGTDESLIGAENDPAMEL